MIQHRCKSHKTGVNDKPLGYLVRRHYVYRNLDMETLSDLHPTCFTDLQHPKQINCLIWSYLKFISQTSIVIQQQQTHKNVLMTTDELFEPETPIFQGSASIPWSCNTISVEAYTSEAQAHSLFRSRETRVQEVDLCLIHSQYT